VFVLVQRKMENWRSLKPVAVSAAAQFTKAVYSLTEERKHVGWSALTQPAWVEEQTG
jgi:hypothetical protein